MASTTAVLLLFSVLIGVCAISATARPCKTIFFMTSSSRYTTDDHFLEKSNFHLLRNPNSSPRLTFFVTEIREFHRTRSLLRPIFFDQSIESSSSSSDDDVVVSSEPYYSASSSSVKSSIRERTMDIMSIVGALLFGMGCGALTASTMYLIWSLFAPRRFDFSDEESDDEESDVRHNKNGYAAVPAATKSVPPTADEVAAMKSNE